MHFAATLLGSLSLLLVLALSLALTTVFRRPAAQRPNTPLQFKSGAENASRLLMAILALSAAAALAAVISRIGL